MNTSEAVKVFVQVSEDYTYNVSSQKRALCDLIAIITQV